MGDFESFSFIIHEENYRQYGLVCNKKTRKFVTVKWDKPTSPKIVNEQPKIVEQLKIVWPICDNYIILICEDSKSDKDRQCRCK